MDRGRIVLVPFPYSDLQGMKRRPACVVSTTEYNARSPDVVLAMITSSRARVEHPRTGDAVIEEWDRAEAEVAAPSPMRREAGVEVDQLHVGLRARLLLRPDSTTDPAAPWPTCSP